MNFKDAYKSYNDEIKGDPKVLDAILNGKKQNKKVLFIRPSYVGAIAAMVVIAVSVFGFGNFNKTSNSPQRTYIAANNTNSTEVVPNTRIIDGNTDGKIVTDPQDNIPLNTEVTEPNAATEPQAAQVRDATDSKVYENSVPANESDVEAVAVLEEDGGVPACDVPLTGRAMPAEESSYTANTVTTADCYAYFGFDVTEKTKLPSDITFGGNVIINAQKSEETGEMEYCSFSIDAYSLTNTQRILNVNVTKSNSSFANSDIEFFVSEQTEAVTGGAFTANGISVKIDSVGLTQNEVSDILNSLK